MRRPDIAKERWIARAARRAVWMLADGLTTPDNAARDGMTAVDIDASAGVGGGLGPATRRAAHTNWEAWTAEVAARIASAKTA